MDTEAVNGFNRALDYARGLVLQEYLSTEDAERAIIDFVDADPDAGRGIALRWFQFFTFLLRKDLLPEEGRPKDSWDAVRFEDF